MDRLPTELLSQIVAFCDASTLFRLRRVSKSLNDVATPAAFDTIYVGWIPAHLRCLQKVTTSPLARYVQRVVVNTEMLPLLSRQEWERFLVDTTWDWTDGDTHGFVQDEYDRPEHGTTDNRTDCCGRPLGLLEPEYDSGHRPREAYRMLCYKFSKAIVDREWREFHQLAKSQHRGSQRMATILATASENLVNARKLELIDKRGISTQYASLPPDPVATCSPWKNFLLDPEEYYDSLRHSWQGWHNTALKDNISSSFAVRCIVEALVSRQKDRGVDCAALLEELTVHAGHHFPMHEVFRLAKRSLRSGGPTSSISVKDAHVWLATLDRIDLSFDGFPFNRAFLVPRELGRWIREAKHLRHLVLDLRRAYEYGFFKGFEELEQSPWPLLQHLRYSGSMSEDTLLDVSTLPAPSLRSLELVDVKLVVDEESDICHDERVLDLRWDNVFEDLRQLLCLEHAHVRRLHLGYAVLAHDITFFTNHCNSDSSMSGTVESFLTRKAENLPRQQDWDFDATKIWWHDGTEMVEDIRQVMSGARPNRLNQKSNHDYVRSPANADYSSESSGSE